jgi:terminal uridylyltransferase
MSIDNTRNSIPAKSIDGAPCNIYYFQPKEEQLYYLQQQANKNTESLGSLLIEYFKYFSYSFDYRQHTLSIRQKSTFAKMDKYEYCCWYHTDCLSIEDPFEIHYDVAHVIKVSKMSLLRKEFLVSFFNDG